MDIWDNADVWIHRATKVDGTPWTLAEIKPADVDEAFEDVAGAVWELVGLLNGEDGFPETVEFDESSYNAWGYGEIKKSYRNRRLERKFSALERNAVTEYLESPGDTVDYVIDAKPADVFIGFEVRTDDGKVKRRITTVPAKVKSGGRTDNEQDMASVEYTASIFPDSQKRRFLKQETGVSVENDYTVTITGSAGTWTATVTVAGDAQTATGLAYNITFGALKTAIEALSNVGAGNATVTGSGGVFAVTVPGTLSANGAGLTGGTAIVAPA
ncbi:hypothetical protein [Nocardia salmonicida]|uniref:hypothetical protein n=1 Tax=Nocardia salmonicida TaxID=53431 RepID=UPI002E2DA34A|nr:hypothetical protein [Nocardia salmonicida]